MTTLATITQVAATEHLYVSGILYPTHDDPVPDGTQTIVLLSPDEPAFWEHFSRSAEYKDGTSDPLDRWSVAAFARITAQMDARALFPFGGPPWMPFISWAKRSGRAHSSPVGLLCHDTTGLFTSYRGALALREKLAIPPTGPSPCTDCAAPCTMACPVDAFATGSYDVPLCKSHILSDAGTDCRTGGCLVRRACPVGADRRLPAQSAFHMKAFA